MYFPSPVYVVLHPSPSPPPLPVSAVTVSCHPFLCLPPSRVSCNWCAVSCHPSPSVFPLSCLMSSFRLPFPRQLLLMFGQLSPFPQPSTFPCQLSLTCGQLSPFPLPFPFPMSAVTDVRWAATTPSSFPHSNVSCHWYVVSCHLPRQPFPFRCQLSPFPLPTPFLCQLFLTCGQLSLMCGQLSPFRQPSLSRVRCPWRAVSCHWCIVSCHPSLSVFPLSCLMSSFPVSHHPSPSTFTFPYQLSPICCQLSPFPVSLHYTLLVVTRLSGSCCLTVCLAFIIIFIHVWAIVINVIGREPKVRISQKT